MNLKQMNLEWEQKRARRDQNQLEARVAELEVKVEQLMADRKSGRPAPSKGFGLDRRWM